MIREVVVVPIGNITVDASPILVCAVKEIKGLLITVLASGFIISHTLQAVVHIAF